MRVIQLLVWIALFTNLSYAQKLHITAQWCHETPPIISVDSTSGLTPPLLYSFNDDPFSFENSFRPNRTGKHDITVKDSNSIEVKESVRVYPSGYISISYDSSHATCDTEAEVKSIQIKGGLPPTSYTINGTTGNADVRNGGNIIIIEDRAGCKATHTVELEDFCWTMYTGFSPNGDGINDTWDIDQLENEFPNAFVQVKNRFGQLVFRSEGQYKPWDGKSLTGQELPSGSYYYQIFPFGIKERKYEVYGIVTIGK